jgi:hypothetical protein
MGCIHWKVQCKRLHELKKSVLFSPVYPEDALTSIKSAWAFQKHNAHRGGYFIFPKSLLAFLLFSLMIPDRYLAGTHQVSHEKIVNKLTAVFYVEPRSWAFIFFKHK